MLRRLARLSLVLASLAAAPALAGVTLTVSGVDPELQAAVAQAVELTQYAKRDVSEAQVHRLYARAAGEARQALEPHGYYEATVDTSLAAAGKDWKVTLKITPGEPVRVTETQIEVGTAAAEVPAVRAARRALERLRGQPLDHGAYEAARDALNTQLLASGFLDAKLVTHRVEVTRATHSAVVRLAWDAGTRYRYGAVHFTGSQFHEHALDRYVPFRRGEYFDQNQLLALQQALNGADYFQVVNVGPEPSAAGDGIVDVKVDLVPARRTVWTGGPFIGTDTGFGLRLGMERRWVNRSGHKWRHELVAAQKLKTLSTLYTIPLPGPDQRAWNVGANFRDADTATSKSRTLELVANESRQWHGWTRTLGVHALAGTFTVGKYRGEPDDAPGVERGRSTLLFGEAALAKKATDNPDFTRHGWSLTLAARSTAGTLLADTTFSQLTADAKWIHALDRRARNRLILRGSAGWSWVHDFAALPPQLRFFAGGDRSVRGYGYQTIGPRNAEDRVIGGKSLLVASAEYEHYFTRQWGVASFLDAGNAFTGTDYRPRLGTGLGLRWRSSVGMIRLDLGTPVHDAHRHGVELHLVIGPDL